MIFAIFILPLFFILLLFGILISILQAIFQINDSSVQYVSKLLITTTYFFVTGKDFYNHLLTLIISIFEGR